MKNQLIKALVSVVVLGVFGLHTHDAEARGRIRFGGAGLARGSHHSGPVLSREQLRICVAQQNNINAEGEILDASESVLQLKATEIENLEAMITRMRPLVDQYSQQSVNSFNALIVKHQELVAVYNGVLPKYNTKLEQFEARQNSFNSKCAGHAYYDSDMQAVLAGK